MELKRKRERTLVDISVTLTTVLDSIDARIIDLSENGAQVSGAAMPNGSKFQIEYQGQTIYAQCMWSEVDRMGVRFPFGLSEGPLHDALMMAIPSDNFAPDEKSTAQSGYMPLSSGATGTIGRRPSSMPFGRRTSN